jgi:hypothetical protein
VRRTMDLLDGAQTPESLQLALREYYPMAVVRRRGLALEGEAWYVYRDGRWVPPPEGAEGGWRVSDVQDDLRSTADSIAADSERLKQVEQAKTELPGDDPALADLAAEATQLIDEMAAKATVQSSLVEEAGSGS